MSKLIEVDKVIHNLKKWSDISPIIQRRNEDFIKILENEDTVKAIPLDKVKKAREEIEDKIDNYPDRNISEYEDCLAILDKLIAESEEK